MIELDSRVNDGSLRAIAINEDDFNFICRYVWQSNSLHKFKDSDGEPIAAGKLQPGDHYRTPNAEYVCLDTAEVEKQNFGWTFEPGYVVGVCKKVGTLFRVPVDMIVTRTQKRADD